MVVSNHVFDTILYTINLQNIESCFYNIKYTIPQNNQRTYNIETFQQPIGSLDIEEIKVFLNGVEIFAPVDWRYDVANASSKQDSESEFTFD